MDGNELIRVRPFSIGLLFVLLTVYGCLFSDYDDCRRNYHFVVPWTLSPANYSYSVGDTIELQWTFPFQNTDTITNEVFDLTDVAIPKGYVLVVSKIVAGKVEPVSFQAISAIDEVGKLIPDPFVTLSFSIDPVKTGNGYDLMSKLILHDPGTYILAFTYDHSMFNDQRPIGLCKVEGVRYHSFLNGGDITANHYDRALQLLDTLEAPAVYRRYGMYTFEVVE